MRDHQAVAVLEGEVGQVGHGRSLRQLQHDAASRLQGTQAANGGLLCLGFRFQRSGVLRARHVARARGGGALHILLVLEDGLLQALLLILARRFAGELRAEEIRLRGQAADAGDKLT